MANRCLRRLEGHVARVGALAWNADLLASGSRDRQILLRDIRAGPTSGGGPTYIPTSTAGRSGVEILPHTATASTAPGTLVNIDRESLSVSARIAIYGTAGLPAALQTPQGLQNFAGTFTTIPSDLGNTCPGSVRVLKDHKQEVSVSLTDENQAGAHSRLLL